MLKVQLYLNGFENSDEALASLAREFAIKATFNEENDLVILNNKAIPIKPIPKLDDKTMAEIKGFDKWSFRKESSKTKKIRK